ncbi:MAG: D-alanyl-D-alanine carboxypeptidase [Lachnospiraceae bacterium]|nr:D-alanyl-D-alanine carboxypeptidase [Lachnospiraceae bacterium]
MKQFKRLLSMVMILTLLWENIAYGKDLGIVTKISCTAQTNTEEEAESSDPDTQAAIQITSPSAILMEASTGKVIYEKDAQVRKSPASITKIMTLLLSFEALEAGKIKLEDEVITSAHAKSMGGSQVFLEEGEVQTVDTLLKCIAVASGNDASVAMAEYIAGSEEEFVNQMNNRAAELGMTDTHFEDCCGLTASENHYTSARDIAIMSRELITKHPKIYDYTKIWMEDITHTTKKGSTPFTLSSTNKLLKQYQWTTGLKTGSTSVAKYCFSATANKDGIDLIAVVMAAPDYKIRFQDAMKLLNYGFSVSKLYEDKNQDILEPIPVAGAIEDKVPVAYQSPFQYLDVEGNDLNKITKKIELLDTAKAPIQKGDTAGEAVYYLDNKKIGTVAIIYDQSIEKAYYKDYVIKIIQVFLL